MTSRSPFARRGAPPRITAPAPLPSLATPKPEPCPCGSKRPPRSVKKHSVSAYAFMRCDACGRQAPGSVGDAFVVRNWNQSVRDE